VGDRLRAEYVLVLREVANRLDVEGRAEVLCVALRKSLERVYGSIGEIGELLALVRLVEKLRNVCDLDLLQGCGVR
jgi:hypothetical protein